MERTESKEILRNITSSQNVWRSLSGVVHNLNVELFKDLDQLKQRKLQKLCPITRQQQSETKRVVKIPESVELNQEEEDLLSKGLSFVPTSKVVDMFKSLDDTDNFYRKIRLKAYFAGLEEDREPGEECNDDFGSYEQKLTRFTPQPGQFQGVDKFINNCKKQIAKSNLAKPVKNLNLSVKELEALRKLKKREDIVIKPADKGGAVCVWSKDKYIEEGKRQLHDERFYKTLDSDKTNCIQREIVHELEQMIDEDKLPEKAKRLLVRAPRCAAFYLLPKIHKENIPGRPVVSNINCPTYQISKFLSNQLKPIVRNCPGYIKDTTHLLQKIEELYTIYKEKYFDSE